MLVANNADELFNMSLDALEPVNDEFMAKELINAQLCLLDPTRNTMCNCKRKMPIRYAVGELCWYNSRVPTAESIRPFSSFWDKITNDDGETVNSNYGWCIHDKYGFDQWDMVKHLLIENPNTRQAVVHIKEARDIVKYPVKDLNCTVSLQFLLRDNMLNLITTMRSNDIWIGLPYDVFNFTCMQIQMAMELGVKIGYYYHNAGSLHLYKKDLKNLEDNSNAVRV